GDADESFPEEVQVLDPRHPLFGRKFQVLGRSLFRRGSSSPFYEIAYCDGVTLNVPVAVTEPCALLTSPTKLSAEALQDLLNVVCLDHEHGTRRSLDDTAGDAKEPDRRRHSGGSSGGLS
ncbi:MAG: hypothetical protein RLP14_00450, partial [Owenweeksia sp.]